MTTEGTYQGKTAAEWRQSTQRAVKAADESYQRCDTDGFLSQWALGQSARQYEMCAELAETNSVWEFAWPFDLDGNALDAVKVDGKFGQSWRIRTANGGTAWFSPSGAKSGARRERTDRAKGYVMGLVQCEAYVASFRTPHRALNVWYTYEPVKGAAKTVIDNGSQQTQYEDYSY